MRPGALKKPLVRLLAMTAENTPLAPSSRPRTLARKARPRRIQRPPHSPGSVRTASPACCTVLRCAPRNVPSPPDLPARRRGEGDGRRRACEPAGQRPGARGQPGPRSPPAPPVFRNLAWRAESEAPRRRQAEPTGALGQLPPNRPPRAHAEFSIIIIKESPRMCLRWAV